MNLYDLTLAAEVAVSTYRRPDIDEWRSAIDPVLEAAGKPCIGHDSVEAISVEGDFLTVDTAFIIRGCANTGSVSLPVAILRAENPIQAAMRYKLEDAIQSAKHDLEHAQHQASAKLATLARLNAELKDFHAAESNAAS